MEHTAADPTHAVHVPCPNCRATNRVPQARLADDPVCGRCGHALFDGHPVALTDADFDKFVQRAGLPVLVDFWAPWCGPCRSMAPQFEQAARQLKGRVLFAKVDSDQNPRLSQRFGIRSIPTLVRLEGGAEQARVSGGLQAGGIVSFATGGG